MPEALRLRIADDAPIAAPVGPATPTPDAPAPDRTAIGMGLDARGLIKLSDLFKLLAVSRSTGHRLSAAGKIGPKPIKLTAGCVRFDSDEVCAWLSTRKPDGGLHDERTWGPVWSALQRRR